MKKYIITYFLRSNSENYIPFYEAIKVNFPEYRHIMEPVWIVKTDKSAKEIMGAIHPKLKQGDAIFVTEMGGDYEGMIAKSMWDFIKSD